MCGKTPSNLQKKTAILSLGRLQQGAKERMEQLEGYSLEQQVGVSSRGLGFLGTWGGSMGKWYDYLTFGKEINHIYGN